MGMTLAQFYKELKSHDWYYQYSDDSRVYRAGKANEQRLFSIAFSKGVEWVSMYKAFKAHYSSGKNFGTEQQPLPVEPS